MCHKSRIFFNIFVVLVFRSTLVTSPVSRDRRERCSSVSLCAHRPRGRCGDTLRGQQESRHPPSPGGQPVSFEPVPTTCRTVHSGPLPPSLRSHARCSFERLAVCVRARRLLSYLLAARTGRELCFRSTLCPARAAPTPRNPSTANALPRPTSERVFVHSYSRGSMMRTRASRPGPEALW